jgi:hypothetical protein
VIELIAQADRHAIVFPEAVATTTDILHIPFSYFPDPVGGTETYVAGLVAALPAHGLTNAVAVPGEAAMEQPKACAASNTSFSLRGLPSSCLSPLQCHKQ